MSKAKASITGTIRLASTPKRTRQGDGQNSNPFRGKQRHKRSRGQGNG